MGKVITNRFNVFDVAVNRRTSKEGFIDSLQSKINYEFENTSSIQDVLEESTIGSKEFIPISLRVTHIIKNNVTGRFADDFKELIFKNIDHARGLGQLYQFSNNYWITINSDYYKYPTASVVVRRCNNVLRFVDNDTGEYFQEPCIIDDEATYNNGIFREPIALPAGVIKITCQSNDVTNRILKNRRFLFGNTENAFFVQSVSNFFSKETFGDNDPLIQFELAIDQLREADNRELRIADYYLNPFTLNIIDDSFEQTIGYSKNLAVEIKRGKEIVSRNVVWKSSDPEVVSITDNGEITLLSNGEATIQCSLYGNPFVSDSIVVSVSEAPVSVVQNIISPEVTYILQEDTSEYSVYQYKNGVQQLSSFTITSSGVPSAYYSIAILSGNSFSVKNLKRYPNGKLKLVCTNDEDGSVVETNITLAGVV